MKNLSIATAILVSSLVVIPSVSHSYEPNYDSIVDLLSLMRTAHPNFSRLRSTGSTMSYMNEGEYESFAIDLPTNGQSIGTFEIMAVCDKDCQDISLDVYNSHGRKIAMNRDGNDMPIVRFNIDRHVENRIIVHVNMNECDAEPCEYGLEVYEEVTRAQ